MSETEETEFEALVADAIDALPDEFVAVLEKVPVVVSDLGTDAHAYGQYFGDGVARDFVADRIVIYQDTLERDLGHVGVPRKRSGEAYFPSFLEPRRPCEQAIVACVMEAYVNGVSTRKVDRLVEQLGIHGMTKDRVSDLCKGLDERVGAFRERPLEGAYPYLWLDAKHLKVRSGPHVRSKALVVAYAVSGAGNREVIGIDIGEVESEAFWVSSAAACGPVALTGSVWRSPITTSG